MYNSTLPRLVLAELLLDLFVTNGLPGIVQMTRAISKETQCTVSGDIILSRLSSLNPGLTGLPLDMNRR